MLYLACISSICDCTSKKKCLPKCFHTGLRNLSSQSSLLNNLLATQAVVITTSFGFNDSKQDICIYGDIGYYDSININTSKYSPNIMGPFSYVPFMECNHAIISMKNKINGEIVINDSVINFNGGIGYIEKDYGCSFPKSYIWCQGNSFKNSDTSFMLSIANIPFKIFNFRFDFIIICPNINLQFAVISSG